ncbi:hypothetical protein QUF80_02080 [Desulfococcaceae bacterium HSG8]|nr:hypothetical protein [Desulfococcaceae bacterium HSG8]
MNRVRIHVSRITHRILLDREAFKIKTVRADFPAVFMVNFMEQTGNRISLVIEDPLRQFIPKSAGFKYLHNGKMYIHQDQPDVTCLQFLPEYVKLICF